MSGALVRGGPGSEVTLNQILPSHLRGASRQRREAVAREYETHHPGSVVVCDWEVIGDDDIAVMDPDDAQQALADREALALRRESSAKMEPAVDAPRGGDPDRARELLRRAKNEIGMLDPRGETGPYEKRFNELAKQINELEDALGQYRTKYKIGQTLESPSTQLTAARKREIGEKVSKYRSLPIANRRASIDNAKDPALSLFLFESETEEELRVLWATKLVEIGAVAGP